MAGTRRHYGAAIGWGIEADYSRIAIGGTATMGVDYSLGNASANSVFIPAGVREVWLQFQPIPMRMTRNQPKRSLSICNRTAVTR